MKRTAKLRLLLSLALLHLFSDVAFAGGAVLCVGPDDHRAVESQHLADLGCQSSDPAEAQTTTVLYSQPSPATSDCADSLLHSEVELVSQAGDAWGHALKAFAPGRSLELNAETPLWVRSRAARAWDLLPAPRPHRTIVLLI